MTLNIKTRDQFVEDEIAAIQAAAPNTFLFPPGSIIRAFVDGHSSTAIWLQANQQLLYNRERLASSQGEDVDSFLADFGLTRLPAVPASGEVTFSSYTYNTQRLIAVGSTVTTPDGDVSFAVIVDTENANYNPSLNAYVMSPATPSIDVPVQATTAGTIGNVNANTITVITSPIPGVDTVTNAVAYDDGQNQQTDAQAKSYFVDYWNSLSKATKTAISYAIESYQEGVTFVLVENENYSDEVQFGFFYAVVDDGSGDPPDSFIDGIRNAVEEVRGFTIGFDIKKPIIVDADISATVVLPDDYSNPDLVSIITTALDNYINLIPFGSTLFYSRIAQVIYNAINSVAPTLIDQFNVTSVLLNGGTSDLTSTFKEKIKPDIINITTT